MISLKKWITSPFQSYRKWLEKRRTLAAVSKKLKKIHEVMEDGKIGFIHFEIENTHHVIQYAKGGSILGCLHFASLLDLKDFKPINVFEGMIYFNDLSRTQIIESFTYYSTSRQIKFTDWKDCDEVWKDYKIFISENPKINISYVLKKLEYASVELV